MKELKFLGVGSGFNTALGSTAAYFIEDKTLFLIDCGESAYARINELGLLKNIDCINFFCTHTHSDHIGSAGNLLLDCKWRSHITFNLICPTNADHFNDIVNILNGFGGRNAYSVIDPALLDRTYKSFTSVRYKPTRHGECKAAYSLVFYTDEGAVFYSGDSETMGFAEELIMGGAKIKQMYFDVSSNANSDAHLPLPNLYRLMPEQFRTRTTCMHFDSDKAIVMAKSMGFNVAVAERGEYE
ncbi:MAG: MBL fold metallo-hydrolase [Candidatus Saccharibacteria bacterium]|nr:MBL fold metallo-hydrolase [Candidatus Saccharibacteria bacterium]